MKVTMSREEIKEQASLLELLEGYEKFGNLTAYQCGGSIAIRKKRNNSRDQREVTDSISIDSYHDHYGKDEGSIGREIRKIASKYATEMLEEIKAAIRKRLIIDESQSQ